MANTAAKKITYDGKPVQVESAIRDSTGRVINTTYATKAQAVEYYEYDQPVQTAQEYPKAISTMGFTSGKIPRIIQVFRPVTEGNTTRLTEILTDTYVTYDSSTNPPSPQNVVIYPPYALSSQETRTIRVTAW